MHTRRMPAARDLAQAVAEPVDAGQRGEGVVDSGRQRSDRDLDELIDREREVLRQGPERAGHMGAAELVGDGGRRVGRPHRGHRVAGDEEVAGPVQQPDDRALLGRDRRQRLMADELQVPARGRLNGAAALAHPSQQLGDRRPGPASRSIALDRSCAMLAITWGSWIEVAMWWMKKIRTPIDKATSPTDTVTDRWGTKSGCPCGPGEIETSTNVA